VKGERRGDREMYEEKREKRGNVNMTNTYLQL
jgi:hypothetical protein